jgi:hypothetical protein
LWCPTVAFGQDATDEAPESARPEPDEGSFAIRIAGAAIFALGALGALAAIPTGVVALEGASDLEETCGVAPCPAAEQGRVDEVYTLAIATDALWISGVSLVVVGGALVALGHLIGTPRDAGAEVTAACLPGVGCWLGATGRF